MNTWLHSCLVAVLGAIALLLAAHALVHVDPASPAFAPVAMLALLAPGLGLGWFTRRHPLLVGAAAGVVAALAADRWLAPVAPGQAIANAMVVAVAALAGRALRRRFAAADATSS